MPRLPAPALAVALALSTAGLQGCIAVVHDEPDPGYETVLEVVALQNAVASDVVVSMTGLLQDPDSCLEPEVSLVADQRTNSIVIRGPRKEVDRTLATIEKLDRKVQ